MTPFHWFLVFTFGVGFVGGVIYESKTAPARTNPPALEHQGEGTLALIDWDRQTENRANCE